MKTRIEEVAKSYGDKAMGNMSPRNEDYGITHYNLIKGFISGAEFMQVEVKDLEYQLEQQKIMNPISVNMIATISDLSEKLKVAVEALGLIAEEYYGSSISMNEARMALEKIKGE